MKRIKLAVFDLEGTLIRNSFRGTEFPSIWKVFCNLCGPEAAEEDAANTRKYYAGGYAGYSYWAIDTIKILKKYGLTKKLFEDVVAALDYFPGIGKTFATLKAQGIRCAIISGGLKALADRVALDFEIEHAFGSAELFWNADGTLRQWNVMPTDFQHKRTLLSMLCHDLKISRNECAFIGDGRNDKDVAGFAGLSIGFNPHQEMRDAASVVIEQARGRENLAAVLQPLLKYPFFESTDFLQGHVWNSNNPQPSVRTALSATLSESGQRNAFHAYLISKGFKTNSADSYCSYVNNLCRNIAESGWNGSSEADAYTKLAAFAAQTESESDFIDFLAQPLSGPFGRQNDSVSAAKQFYNFTRGNK